MVLDPASRMSIPMIPRPSETVWEIRGQRCVARFWTIAQWERTPREDRPGEAQPHANVGWLVIENARD